VNETPPLTRWEILTAAPHRPLFLAGATQLVLVILIWSMELLGRLQPDLHLPLAVSATAAHGFLMLYGIFPFFILGFLFTVYPRWMGGKPLARRDYSTVFVLLAGGMLLIDAGLFVATAMVAAGLVLVLAGWGCALWNLYRVYARAPKRTEHETLLNFALAAAWFGVAAFLAAILGADAFWFRFAREAGLWLFLVPVVFLVAHRMVPFFSQSGLINYIMVRPAWGPSVMVVCVVAHMGFELAGLNSWRFLADLPLAVAALHHTWVWQFRRTFHARLVAMLHIAFLWLCIGMTLFTLQSLGLLLLGKDLVGRAALHALGIGFFTGMIVAMASRVTLGHSGRQLQADTLTWGVLIGVNISAVLRIAGEFLPPVGALLNLAAAVVWLVSLGAWVARYAPIYVRPRPDGVPG